MPGSIHLFVSAELDVPAAHPFFTAASLGPRIPRAGTVSIVGLALLQAASLHH